jgi:hypothetical protein
MLRLRLGVGTRADWAWCQADEKQRHTAMLQAVQHYMNEMDRKDTAPNEHTSLADVTRKERPSKKW